MEMTVYTVMDKKDNLTKDQLESMANSDHSLLIRYIEENTIFDAHRIRLLLELGCEKATDMAIKEEVADNGNV